VSANSTPSNIRFSAFEVNLQTGELRKHGQKLKLQEQPFQLLVALLGRPGELVTREELRKKLWPADTFVDFDHGLNAAVKRLRDALGESAEAPVFIETLARRGYRFVAPVDGGLTPIPIQIAPAAEPDTSLTKHRVRPWMFAAAGLVIAAVAILLFVSLNAVREPKAQPRLVPLTAYPGREYEPALAPDGNRVAFAWSGPDLQIGRTASIYTKQVGEEKPLRLTSVPGAIDFGPDWSPDGAYIVFGRFPAPNASPGSVEEGIYIVPSSGGTERRVHSTNWTLGPIVDSRVAWAPDGKTVAFSDRPAGQSNYALFALNVTTLEARQITFPTQSPNSDIHVAFSPDSRTLAFLRDNSTGWTSTSFPPPAAQSVVLRQIPATWRGSVGSGSSGSPIRVTARTLSSAATVCGAFIPSANPGPLSLFAASASMYLTLTSVATGSHTLRQTWTPIFTCCL
jgi:DNA-binding winged helix-turn-helix (wHTH) protein